MGNAARDQSKRGLSGNRSGLFFTFIDVVAHYRPQWVVWENVPAVLSSNDCRDFETVIQSFAKLGYVGHARVLDSQFFGVPQKRRRLYLVAGLGRFPSSEFLDDAAAVESIPCAAGSSWLAKSADAWAGYTLTAQPKCAGASGHGRHGSRISLGSELLVAEEDGWDQMVERARAASLHGLRAGLDETNAEEAFAAGNAVVPAIAQWIAEILNRS
jgi:DNA (cytosine-5)-methyltransferase 1